MRRLKGRGPSPAMVVAGAALVVALAGTAVAAPLAIQSVLNKGEKKQVRKIARKQVKSMAGGLTVGNSRNLDGLDSKELSPAAGVNRTDDATLTDSYSPVTTTNITTAADSTLVLQASVHLDSDGGNNDRGDCRFSIDGTGGIGYSTDIVNNDETMPVTQTQAVGAGLHTVQLECLKNLAGSITLRNAAMSVTAHL